jgi:hypothetical protein
MTVFNIPRIECDEPTVRVEIVLDCVSRCGSLEYLSGKRDGEMIVFGSREADEVDGEPVLL